MNTTPKSQKWEIIIGFITWSMLLFGTVTLLVGLFATMWFLKNPTIIGIELSPLLTVVSIIISATVMFSGIILMVCNMMFNDLFVDLKNAEERIASLEFNRNSKKPFG